MPFTYRRLFLPDLILAQKIGRDTYEPYYQHKWHTGGLDWYMERCFGAGTLAAELVDENIEYWLPEDPSGQIAGILKLVLQKPVPDHPIQNALYLEKIYLLPDFMGKGIGQQVIGFAKQRATQLKRDAIWLTVMKSGPVGAYEKAGFRIIGEVHWDFDLLRKDERDGWLMVLQ